MLFGSVEGKAGAAVEGNVMDPVGWVPVAEVH